jgi:peptide/nickel transport system permease protein
MKGYARYYRNKLLWYLLTLVVAVILNFLLPRLIPGNPVSLIVSQMMNGIGDSNSYARVYNSFAKEFGLDKPLYLQFFQYLGNLLRGDMGTSFTLYPRKVSDVLASALPWTIGLQLPSIAIGWILGNVLGACAAYKRGAFDKVMFPASLMMNAIPAFSFSLILLYVFAVSLKWFPIGGGYAASLIPSFSWQFFTSVLGHYWLPFLSLVLVAIGGQAIGMRSMVIYELNSDYVLYARLLGIRDRRIVRYVFKNAMLPQITGLALTIGTMTAGALITEIVFNYPGIGLTMFKAIKNTDYTMISGCTLIITLMVLAANFLIEIIYGLVDPRIRSVQQEES